MCNAFPFSDSDDTQWITEADIARVEEDLQFLFPPSPTPIDRSVTTALGCHHYMAPDIPSGRQLARPNVWEYTGYLASGCIANKKDSVCFHLLPNLQLLFTLPVELVFAILGLLHPVDLYHLSRCSTSLCHLLWSKQTRLLWKAAFYKHPNIPECPRGFIEPRWATFLYLDSCDMCNAKASFPEWYIRRRLCRSCAVEHTVPPPQGLVYTLLPRTYEDRMCWKNDVITTQNQLNILRRRVNTNGPDAQMNLDLYLDEQKNILSMALKHANTCRLWEKGLRDAFRARVHTRQAHCAARVRKLLIRYKAYPGKTTDALIPIEVTDRIGQRYLSRQRFEFLCPTLEGQIREVQRSRLLRERQNIIRARIGSIQEEYRKFLARTVSTRHWGYQPRGDLIMRHFEEYFFPLVHAPDSDPIPNDKMEAAFETFPVVFDTWKHEQMEKLATLAMLNNVQDLELATAVFTCTCRNFILFEHRYVQNYNCMIGWDEAGQFIDCRDTIFSIPGFKAAESLIRLVGLDPKETTATKMDQRDARFFCACCPMKYSRGKLARGAMDWRHAVFHYVQMCNDLENGQDPEHETPAWFLLTAAAMTETKRRIGDVVYMDGSHHWYCCHCSIGLGCPLFWRGSTIRTHIRQVHDIQRPVDGIDFVCSQKSLRPRNKPVFLSDPSYTCRACFPKGRLFNRKQLDSHIRTRHYSPNGPQQTLDVATVKVIED